MTALAQVKSRVDIDPTDQWNVSALYPSFEKWEADFKEIKKGQKAPFWPQLAKFKGILHQSPEMLKQLLDLSFGIARQLEKLFTYAHLRHDEDITLDQPKSCYQRISSTMYDFQQEVAWIEPEILALPKEVIDRSLASSLLADYKFHLERILRLKEHTLTSDKEELLAMAAKPAQAAPRAFSALNNADIRFPDIKDRTGKSHPLTHSLYQLYLRSQDRTVRESAFKAMHGTFGDFENTCAELLQGEIQSHLFQAQAHHYPSCLSAALFPKNIPLDVYHSLIQTVRSHLPVLHHYIQLRKRILKLPEIHLYDMYVPLVPHVDIRMDYKEAEAVVVESVAPLGKEYQNTLQKGLLSERWVDRYENRNKRSGAYSSGCYDSHPYILMNYRGILRDVFTLAHEAGHSMHSYLSNTAQPYYYSHYPIFLAEVASTFNEELLSQLLRQRMEKKEEKIFLINEKIEDIRATFFRQTLFAEFELKIHDFVEKGVPLTPRLLKETFYQLNQDYFGPDVVIDPEIAIEWARIPHFYYNFYVFQYATGISAALAFAEKIGSHEEGAKDRYLDFLKAGGSAYPIDLLKRAGIDMTTASPVIAAIKKFKSLVQDLETLVYG